MKSDITSLDLRYNFCTDCGIFLSEISWLETEIPKNVQEGTNTMSVFIKCNGSPGREVGYAGKNIQLVFAGLNQISIFLAYTSQTLSYYDDDEMLQWVISEADDYVETVLFLYTSIMLNDQSTGQIS